MPPGWHPLLTFNFSCNLLFEALIDSPKKCTSISMKFHTQLHDGHLDLRIWASSPLLLDDLNLRWSLFDHKSHKTECQSLSKFAQFIIRRFQLFFMIDLCSLLLDMIKGKTINPVTLSTWHHDTRIYKDVIQLVETCESCQLHSNMALVDELDT